MAAGQAIVFFRYYIDQRSFIVIYSKAKNQAQTNSKLLIKPRF